MRHSDLKELHSAGEDLPRRAAPSGREWLPAQAQAATATEKRRGEEASEAQGLRAQRGEILFVVAFVAVSRVDDDAC